MDWIVSFIVSVAANIVSNCVSKWLDRHSREQYARHRKKRPSGELQPLPEGRFLRWV